MENWDDNGKTGRRERRQQKDEVGKEEERITLGEDGMIIAGDKMMTEERS